MTQLKTVIYFLFFSFSFLKINGQSSKILDNYVKTALERNLQIQQSELNSKKQSVKIAQAKKLWGPTTDLNLNYLLARGGRTINFPIGDLFNPTYATLNQLTGTNSFPVDLENREIQLTPNNFLDAQFSVSQPIINSSIRYNLEIQKALLQLDNLEIDIKEKAIKSQLKAAYFNYLKSLHGGKILDESNKLLEELLVFNKKLVKFDKATDEVIADVEFQIEQLNSQKAILVEQNILAKSLFNILLNQDLETNILVDNNLVMDLDFDLKSLGTYKTIALANRTELQKIEVAEKINDLNQKRIKKEAQPVLGIQGGVGVQSEDFSFDEGGPLYTLGLGASISLFDNGQRKKRIEEIAVDKEILNNTREMLNQQISIEVVQVFYALKTLQSKMLSEEAAEKSAQKSLDRFQTKYENDKALLIELLQAQNRLTTSQLAKTITKYDYLIKLAELERVIN